MAQIYLKGLFLLCFVISIIIHLAHKTLPFTGEAGEACISMFMGGFYAMDDCGQKGTWHAPCELIYRSTINESADCLRKRSVYLGKENHIVLIGDSRIRQLRDGLIYQLSGVEHDFYVNPAIAYDQQLYKKHESTVTRLPSANLLIEFFWSVEMDEEGGTFGHALRTLESKGAKPDMIIIGAGIWVMKVCTYQNTSQVECLRNFKKNLIKPLQMLNRFADTGTVLWTPQNLVDEPRLLYLEYSHKELTNKNMMYYNNAIRKHLLMDPLNKIIYWESYLQTDLQIDDTADGLHIGPTTRSIDIQFLLNYLCNPYMKKDNFDFRNRFSRTNICCER